LGMEKRGDVNLPDEVPKLWNLSKKVAVGRKITINRHKKTFR